MDKTGIEAAVEAMRLKAPDPRVARAGHSELARAVGVTPQAVHIWVELGYVPVGRARQVGMVSGVDHRLLVDPAIRDLFENPPKRRRA